MLSTDCRNQGRNEAAFGLPQSHGLSPAERSGMGIRLPVESRHNATYEVRQSEGPDQPLAAASATLHIAGGIVRQARVVLGQVAPVPWISEEAAAAILGKPVSEATAAAAGEAAVASAPEAAARPASWLGA